MPAEGVSGPLIARIARSLARAFQWLPLENDEKGDVVNLTGGRTRN